MKQFNDIKNKNELAKLLGIPLQLLTYTLYIANEDKLYTTFEIPKKSGGVRKIDAPVDPLKSIQIKLFNELTEYIHHVNTRDSISSNISHGFIRDKSIITNAEIHRNKHYVINVDIKDYFPSFHFGRVKGFFEKNNYFKLPTEIAVILAQITCYKGALPQGAPTSPIIANLISNILDFRILKLTKKYKLDYTRYADDLTFSTNNQSFLKRYQSFLKELDSIIKNAGFEINENKTRLQYKESRQEVTGLTVNKKINSKKEFRKNTRAMAHNLYSTGSFYLNNGIQGTIKQLDGRFSFINYLDWYNTFNTGKISQEYHKNLSSREKDYRNFLFYRMFMANRVPLLVIEGKKDIKYIKAAIKKLYSGFSLLGEYDSFNNFSYKLSFFDRFKHDYVTLNANNIPKQDKLKLFFSIEAHGADTIKNIYNHYTGAHGFPNLSKFFADKYDITPKVPVILIFDNEEGNDYPLGKFLKHIRQNKSILDISKIEENMSEYNYSHIISNLYVLTLPRINGKNTEVEDLLMDKDINSFKTYKGIPLDTEINESYKNSLANYIFNNYNKIDFHNFKPLFSTLNKILISHNP